MIHIGISGKIGSGKSTLAASLKQFAIENGYACEVVPFAYGVREVAALEKHEARKSALVNLFHAYGYDYATSSIGARLADAYMRKYPTLVEKKNRRLLQSIGTEVGRMAIDEDIWIKRTHYMFRGYPLDFGISDDLRFDNEAMAVDIHVGITIDGVAQSSLYLERINTFGADYTNSNHASEQSLTLPPLFTIPIGFTQTQILELFDKIDRVRKLRAS